MKKYLSRRKKKKLLAALLTGLCLVTPWNRAEAVTSHTAPNGLFRMDYYDAGESLAGTWMFEAAPEALKKILTSQGTLSDWQKQSLNFAADYWDGLLKHTKTAKPPVALAFTVYQDFNNAQTIGSYCYVEAEEGGYTFCTTPNAILNHGEELTEDFDPVACIIIGTALYPTDAPRERYDTPLPQNRRASLTPTMIHEIGHAIGDCSCY